MPSGPEEEELKLKVKRAAHMLFFRHHGTPGLRGWELRRALGSRYLDVLKLLDQQIRDLGLMVKAVSDTGGDPMEDPLHARFFITFSERPDWPEFRGSGWRIDEAAILAASIAFVASRGGRAPYSELRDMLERKFPVWIVERTLQKLFRMGYLSTVEEDKVAIGWRTRVEVDLKTLLSTLIGKPPSKEERK